MSVDLLEEGKRRRARAKRLEANAKAREEMRNAARTALTEEGFSPGAIKSIAKSMASQALTEFMNSQDINRLMLEILRAEVDRQLGRMGVETTVREAIKQAVAEYAKERVSNAILIQVKDHW